MGEHEKVVLNGREYFRVSYGYRVALEKTIKQLQQDVLKWKRIRTPSHGSCCTCQACGLYYDECRCDLDDVVDELARAQADIKRLRAIDAIVQVSRFSIRGPGNPKGSGSLPPDYGEVMIWVETPELSAELLQLLLRALPSPETNSAG